jgi:hypothetical protein
MQPNEAYGCMLETGVKRANPFYDPMPTLVPDTPPPTEEVGAIMNEVPADGPFLLYPQSQLQKNPDMIYAERRMTRIMK